MAYKLLEHSQLNIDALQANIRLFKTQVNTLALISSNSAIQCIILGDNEKTKTAAASLQQAGLDVRAILSPTVAAGAERIRICLHAFNTADEITQLTSAINNIINE
ncbi:MAG: pyridoxal phosphate-dependent aminotransferase family protein [Mucilaginibacter sp.]|nr:pyridoxal phosphate-dependent aminotransferase family protein [Mucilaginibacter sp.]